MRLPTTRLTTLVLTAIGVMLVRPGWSDDKPSFDKWEKDIAAFEQKDKESPPPKNAVLFAGSSSIRRWDLKKSFPDLDAINRGFGGSQIADSTHFAPRIILKAEPRRIVFYAGDNDLAAGKKPEQVADDFRDFAQLVHKDLPRTKIIFISVKPSLARWEQFDKQKKANELIEAFCKKNDYLTYVDVVKPMLGDDGKPKPELFVKDGLHLTEKGYEVWAGLLKPLLR
jgi:lysophospholipase L1-like esterase